MSPTSEFCLYLNLLKEGYSIRDKAYIFLYLLCAPLRYLYKMIGKDFDRLLLREVTVKNEDGLFFCDRSFSSCRVVSSFYERDMRHYFNLKEGVFVDVGSHIGKYVIRMAAKLGNRGKVVAIEPEEHNFELLKMNVELNHLKNVNLQNVACFSTDGDIPLYVDEHFNTLHSFQATKGSRPITVRAQRLDTLLSHLHIDEVHMIKLDVEGAELDVLKGATKTLKQSHPIVIFEAWDTNAFERIRSFLQMFGYQIRQISEENYFAW